ncbi:MobC family plasmid mobilization relaxosome protein [Streptomyces akebiae]|uniref:MobC family plasmid mobilization relaxosome protein n=1 Tax=Streptomyces akebiae TaxID=2865673 RepID=A0ABX8XSY2_9ACTN|nr:MobC family plasmid mobilization relaxosome protein [Streptomyces akebiae]QYX79016.1 MobC family plasmid mobilization relaxosome protein [Streptomyces akebiae]
MHDPSHDPSTTQVEMTAAPATTASARYAVGPSKDGRNGDASAPGVAETLGHQGAPEEKQPDTAAVPLPRAADTAALHRVARRRQRESVQRKERVDVRYSVDEKADILAEARSLNIAAAHYVGAVVMAHVHGDLGLPGQRTELDDYIDELTALRREVAKIGHNVNQIAKKVNSGGHPHPGDTAVLAQAEQTVSAVGAAVRHIASAANQAVTVKAA